jgi:hypothetical protein
MLARSPDLGVSDAWQVKAIANAVRASFFTLSGAAIFSPYVGDAERTVRETFAQARAGAPSVLFLDEVRIYPPIYCNMYLLREISIYLLAPDPSGRHAARIAVKQDQQQQRRAGAGRFQKKMSGSAVMCQIVPSLLSNYSDHTWP